MQPDPSEANLAFETLLASGDHLAFARNVLKKPTLEGLRARETVNRTTWERFTEARALVLPEPFRDGFRLGRWMQWAGRRLHMRASLAAAEAGCARPDPSVWQRGYRLMDLADVVMGAACRWQERMEPLAGFREPAGVDPPTGIGRRQLPLTLERFAEAIIANGMLPFAVRMTPPELRAGTAVAQALEATGRHQLAGVLRHVLGVCVTRADLTQAEPATALDLGMVDDLRRKDLR